MEILEIATRRPRDRRVNYECHSGEVRSESGSLSLTPESIGATGENSPWAPAIRHLVPE